jgi:hypothetical protein
VTENSILKSADWPSLFIVYAITVTKPVLRVMRTSWCSNGELNLDNLKLQEDWLWCKWQYWSTHASISQLGYRLRMVKNTHSMMVFIYCCTTCTVCIHNGIILKKQDSHKSMSGWLISYFSASYLDFEAGRWCASFLQLTTMLYPRLSYCRNDGAFANSTYAMIPQ